jgi:K(+)-stimulated pyrophosphate-energized sodium pump
MNPVIKFTTLFGLLATEIAVTMHSQTLKTSIAVVFFIVALVFIYRSFYGMRIGKETLGNAEAEKKLKTAR